MIFAAGCAYALFLAFKVSETFVIGGIVPGIIHLSCVLLVWEWIIRALEDILNDR